MTRDEIEAHIRTIVRTCRGPRSKDGDEVVAAALASGDLAAAAAADDQFRTPCGYDVNLLILAEPLDGQRHEAYCPQCGVLHDWTPAVLTEDTPSTPSAP